MAASSVKKIQLEKEVEVSEGDLAALVAADAYSPDVTLYNDFFTNTFYEQHHRGTFTTADNLGDMAKESFAVRMILRFIIRVMLSTMK